MDVITMHQAKSALSQLVAKAESGETIYIGAHGKAQAKLVSAQEAGRLAPKKLGVLSGKLQVPDDFDAPLPNDLIGEFLK